ncbi:MAG: TlpA family protein disulfide reductase [Flavipsychrobacter sp.]|nr:TlpA family protein disulfide reductase [Flavipsychrobacter sp.]
MKLFLKTLIVVSILSVSTGFVRNWSLSIDLFVSFGAFFLATWYFTNKVKSINTLLLLLVNILLINVVVTYLLDGKLPLLGLPNILCMIAGTLTGYFFYTAAKKVHKIITLLLGAITCISLYATHEKWVHYLNFGNISGSVAEPGISDVRFYNKQGETINATDYTSKIAILDFWNRGCLVCYQKFPKLQQLYNKYKSDPRIVIQAVNIPLEGDNAGIAFDIVEQKGYTFPVIIGANNADSIFQINVYPTVILINNGKIIYRGGIEPAMAVVEDLLR